MGNTENLESVIPRDLLKTSRARVQCCGSFPLSKLLRHKHVAMTPHGTFLAPVLVPLPTCFVNLPLAFVQTFLSSSELVRLPHICYSKRQFNRTFRSFEPVDELWIDHSRAIVGHSGWLCTACVCRMEWRHCQG